MTTDLIPATLPSYLAKFAQDFPELASINQDALNGLSVGQPPSIGFNGTRFVVKEGGEQTTLQSLELLAVIIRSKPNMDKAWYASKFTPGDEPSAPECWSKDGIRPDASAVVKQHAQCAGCPRNEFGSGVDAQGNPSKGKACTDKRVLAIYTNSNVYQFNVPPASLKAFTSYVKQLSMRGVPLPTCVTKIGFDPKFSYPVLTFDFGGMMTEAQFSKIGQIIRSSEVAEIIGDVIKVESLPAPVAQAEPAPPVKKAAAKKAAPVVAPDPVFYTPEPEQLPEEAHVVNSSPTDEELMAALGI